MYYSTQKKCNTIQYKKTYGMKKTNVSINSCLHDIDILDLKTIPGKLKKGCEEKKGRHFLSKYSLSV